MAKNKIAQEQRRAIRDYVGQQYMIINDVFKKRPRWVPLWLWSIGASIFIDKPKLQKYMREGISPRDRR